MVKCPECKKEDEVRFVEGGTMMSSGRKYYVCERCNIGFCKFPDGTITEMSARWAKQYLRDLRRAEGGSITEDLI